MTDYFLYHIRNNLHKKDMLYQKLKDGENVN
jgi:hypothetical protein